MADERAELLLARRRDANQRLPLSQEFIAGVLQNGFKSISQQQIDIIRHRPDNRAHILEIRQKLIVQGYKGEPSPTRIRAEFLASISLGWQQFADRMYEDGDLRTYQLFTDIGVGSMAVSGAIIHADDVVSQAKRMDEERKIASARAITNIAGEANTSSSADFYLRLDDLVRQYAELLREDPTGYSVARKAATYTSTPKSEDPFPIPHITEFVEAGAQLGIRILEELQKLQESHRA